MNFLDVMSNPMSLLGGGDGGSDAAEASLQASRVQASAETEALNYLKEIDKLPQQYREEAMAKLAGIYGLEGGTGSQQDLIDQAESSPLYAALMGGQKTGEDAIMRHAGMTGGLRSGNVQGAMYDYNTQLQNQALLSSYNEQLGGLTGLSQTPSLAGPIASYTAGIGQTKAQGITGAAQATQVGQQQQTNNMFGMAGLGMDIWSMFA